MKNKFIFMVIGSLTFTLAVVSFLMYSRKNSTSFASEEMSIEDVIARIDHSINYNQFDFPEPGEPNFEESNEVLHLAASGDVGHPFAYSFRNEFRSLLLYQPIERNTMTFSFSQRGFSISLFKAEGSNSGGESMDSKLVKEKNQTVTFENLSTGTYYFVLQNEGNAEKIIGEGLIHY